MNDKKRRILAGIIFGGIFLILILAYFNGLTYYMNHFYPSTKLGYYDIGGKTVEEVIELRKQMADDFIFTIYGSNDERVFIKGKDFGYQYKEEGEEEKLLSEQKLFSWPLEIFRKHYLNIEHSNSFDENELIKQIMESRLFDDNYVTLPQNAYVEIRENSADYIVHKEENGSQLEKDKVIQVVCEALEDSETSVTLPESCYEKAQISDDSTQITNVTAELDEYLSSTIHYSRDGLNETLKAGDVIKFLKVNEDYTVTVDRERVRDYVDFLSRKYNTYGKIRQFTTTNGDTIEIGGGDYGWAINKDAEIDQIIRDIESGQNIERDLNWLYQAETFEGNNFTDTYIEVDYTNQHIWYYKNGELIIDSPCVSGNINQNNGSVDGIFYISKKRQDYILVGEGYSSPVDYFLQFAYNIGFHDASWRSEFGGEIYKTSGSHGCVNLPHDVAKKLFETVDFETPVIAYYREPVTLTNKAAEMANAYSYNR